MMGRLVLVTPPAREPVTLGEVKDHVRQDANDEDALIDAVISTARAYVERILSRSLLTQIWDWQLDQFPCGPEVLHLPRPPLQSITSITYTDTAGDPQIWPAAEYQHDTGGNDPARLAPALDQRWPSTRREFSAVTIRYQAGYGDNEQDVPEPIRQALLLLMGNWYENRDAFLVFGAALHELPFGVSSLLAPYENHIV